jgi:tripartite-type tricarboxylate transporter receptor subunit TctC
MHVPRRQFLHLAAGAATLPALSGSARAQAYPTRAVHLIEGFGAGGTPDIISRLIGQWLSDRLGRSFIIENRSGASGNIATAAVAHAPPDGYTLLMIVPSNSINVTFYNKLDFNFMRDIMAVGTIAQGPLIMQVHPSVPATTVPEFISYAKANAGKINMGSAGTGSLLHMTGELFAMMAGVEMFHVPFRGVQSLMALLAGQVQVTFSPIPASLEYIKAGKLRALAVTTATRSAALPNTPALAEFLPGYDVGTWYGIGAPADTPAAIIGTLNSGINAALADASFNTHLADLGMAPLGGTPAEFGRFVAADVEKWGKVVRFAGVTAD